MPVAAAAAAELAAVAVGNQSLMVPLTTDYLLLATYCLFLLANIYYLLLTTWYLPPTAYPGGRHGSGPAVLASAYVNEAGRVAVVLANWAPHALTVRLYCTHYGPCLLKPTAVTAQRGPRLYLLGPCLLARHGYYIHHYRCG